MVLLRDLCTPSISLRNDAADTRQQRLTHSKKREVKPFFNMDEDNLEDDLAAENLEDVEDSTDEDL